MSGGNLCPQKQKEEHRGALVGAQSLRLQNLRKGSHVYVPKNEVLNSYFDI